MTVHTQNRSPGHTGPTRLAGFALGAGAAAVAPLIARRALSGVALESLADVVKSPGAALGDAASNVGERLGSGAISKVKDAISSHGGDGDDDADQGTSEVPGVGKGRRMPVQQSVDIAAPVETVYNEWTQYEQWPTFMHRVTRVTQQDPCTVSFTTRIWGRTKEFTAEIETQRPDERIVWRATEGMELTGVVTFHELGPNLTRVLLGLDLDPSGPLEKLARGARFMKRAARGDLHRFKAFVELGGSESDGWRGVIEDGKVSSKQTKRASSGGSSNGRTRSSSSSRSGSGSSRASSRSRAAHNGRSAGGDGGRSGGRNS